MSGDEVDYMTASYAQGVIDGMAQADATLRRELAEARKATELCANSQRMLIEKV
jgi:hypothetical protein